MEEMYHSLFNHSSLDRQLGCCHAFATADCAAVNTGLQIFHSHHATLWFSVLGLLSTFMPLNACVPPGTEPLKIFSSHKYFHYLYEIGCHLLQTELGSNPELLYKILHCHYSFTLLCPHQTKSSWANSLYPQPKMQVAGTF